MWLLEQHIRTPVRWISIIGAESLAIYVAHLIVVYGSPLNPGMGAILGKTFSLPAATGLAIILIISMLLFGRLWYTMKSEYERPSRFFQIATALVLLLIFFINEQ
jgi:phosphoglycerol transferase MdoB-like AlkP superfamily enzyme